MKNNKYSYFILLAIILLLVSCQAKKEKICRNLPDGLYEGQFIDDSGYKKILPLEIVNIDDNTLEITIPSNMTVYSVKRSKCTIGGVIDGDGTTGKNCVGEIYKENDVFTIKGTYSYFIKNESGLGNPNPPPMYAKMNGTFQIKPFQ